MSNVHLENAVAGWRQGPAEAVSIAIADDIIEAVAPSRARSGDNVLDCSGLRVLPGFIDIHIHGAAGYDVNSADIDGLMNVARFLAANGVTAWMPTLVPDSDENYRRVIGEIDRLMDVQTGEPVAQAVGVHYEGVFANEKMCGALRPAYFKKFTGTELDSLPRLKRGAHMTTFAPEIEGGIDLVRELRRQGWIASVGHTRADIGTLNAALEAGARHITHFYNAMTGMHHRDLGVVGWAFSESDVTFDIIADGIHVHPKMLEFACRAKSSERVSLISDSVAPTGLGDGEFEIWGETVVVENGRTRNERGSIAGSVITMHDAVRRMLSLGFTFAEAAQMSAANPARLLGIEPSFGSIGSGKRADLVGLDEQGNLELVIVGGKVIRSRENNS